LVTCGLCTSRTVTGPAAGSDWWHFFFSSRRRHTSSDRDWSSDVCSSDLPLARVIRAGAERGRTIAVHELTAEERAARLAAGTLRSEERRVGKEWRSGRGSAPSIKGDSDSGAGSRARSTFWMGAKFGYVAQ